MSPQPAGPVRRFTASRYLAPVLSIVAVGVLVTTLVAYFYTRATVENLAQGQITQALSFLDREITMQTHDMVMQTNLMAQEDVLRLALEDSYLGRSARVAAQRKLDAYVRNGAFDRAYLMNLRGRLVLASDQTLTEHLIISDRRYFTQAAAGHHVLETLTVSRVTGRPTLVSSTPLRDPGGSVIGVVVGLISIDAFAREMLNDSRIGQSGGAYLMNRDGAVLGTPGWAAPGAFGVRAANGQAASHAQQLLANARQGGVFRFTRNGARRMCISRLNETTQWVLVLEADEDEVLAPATRLAAVSGAISLVTLLTVFLALGALRRLMTSLRNSEADHRALTELSPVGIVTFGASGRPEYLNRQARTILDIPPDGPPPRTIDLEDGEGQPLEGPNSPFAQVLRDRASIVGLLVWRRSAADERKALYLNATPLAVEGREVHGVVATLEDITERMRALELLHQSEERFSSLFRLSPDSIVLSDLDSGLVVDVNETFCETHGRDREEVIGKTVADLGLYTDPRQLEDLVDRVRRFGQVLNEEVIGHRGDGQEMILSLSSQVMEIGEAKYRMTVARDVTERHRAEQELRENRRLLESILNTVPLSIFWKDKNCVFLGCNKAFARALGFTTPMDVIGKTDFDLPLSPEASASYRLDDQQVMASMTPKLGFVEPLVLDDGRHIWLETSKLPLLDEDGAAVGVLGMFQDITERLEAEEQLRQSEERFSRLFRYSPEAMALVDTDDNRFADANEAFQKLTGYSNQELIGKDSAGMAFYAKESSRAVIHEMIRKDGHVEHYEFEGRKKDGQIIQCAISCHLITIGDKRYILGLVRDVTELKKMQEMMIQTEKMISVGGIAAGIAHEINNPLGIVLQAAQNLVQRTKPDFKKNIETAKRLGLEMDTLAKYMQERKLDVFIADIQAAAVRASAIIRHMLDFSRSSESRRKICDLPAIIDKAITLAGSDYDLKKSYDFKRIRLIRDYADDLPAVNCTETEIEQVLLNLLRNSAQALAEATSQDQEPVITIRAASAGEYVRIEIEDNGPGMPPDVQRRVFEPFYTTKPPGVGTGLGLSVSYFIITKGHGGRMSVRSQPGEGTRFSIELPTEHDAEAPQ
ncbi:PAS domain S-box-containing protein [Humidesulfovibrio mexicanus]|uniref:histidine kinase n=1 Tax=Humidesulfovibrio mexicanus TaxID=147047 RepID=A0A239ARU6_9BACT|nr:PAS domain S-box protein [Humidesulfovibrio mexicanus]SNR97693.1 PAS domain S-box-containing protein [Humidesulfovibrio mexicanus]